MPRISLWDPFDRKDAMAGTYAEYIKARHVDLIWPSLHAETRCFSLEVAKRASRLEEVARTTITSIVLRYWPLSAFINDLSSLIADKVLSNRYLFLSTILSAGAKASVDAVVRGGWAGPEAQGETANFWPGASTVSDCRLAGRSTSSLFSATTSSRWEPILLLRMYPHSAVVIHHFLKVLGSFNRYLKCSGIILQAPDGGGTDIDLW